MIEIDDPDTLHGIPADIRDVKPSVPVSLPAQDAEFTHAVMHLTRVHVASVLAHAADALRQTTVSTVRVLHTVSLTTEDSLQTLQHLRDAVEGPNRMADALAVARIQTAYTGRLTLLLADLVGDVAPLRDLAVFLTASDGLGDDELAEIERRVLAIDDITTLTNLRRHIADITALLLEYQQVRARFPHVDGPGDEILDMLFSAAERIVSAVGSGAGP